MLFSLHFHFHWISNENKFILSIVKMNESITKKIKGIFAWGLPCFVVGYMLHKPLRRILKDIFIYLENERNQLGFFFAWAITFIQSGALRSTSTCESYCTWQFQH